MESLFSKVKIKINQNLFLADPAYSELGKNILVESIDLINEIGFEKFTFKKLGVVIKSPEASIYRYFKSKHQLLSYLVSFYWGWMEHQLFFSVVNIESPEKRLQKAIDLITLRSTKKILIDGIEINNLIEIIISESAKSYLTKDVTKANKEGAYLNYKNFVSRIVDIVLEINPTYKFPNMLISTIIEGAHLQFFFANNLPGLTNKHKTVDYINKFYQSLALTSLKN